MISKDIKSTESTNNNKDYNSKSSTSRLSNIMKSGNTNKSVKTFGN